MILVIALDAADPRLIERWSETGDLPNLKRLRDSGAYGRLASSAGWLSGSPWPTFYTGTLPASHGLYHIRQWRPGRMSFDRPRPDWLPLRPFWRDLGERDRRVIAFDMSMTQPPEPFRGVEVSGWACHDQLGPTCAHPTETARWLRREFGLSPFRTEPWGILDRETLLHVESGLIETTDRTADVTEALMTREGCDLFLLGLGATHLGGHRLWDASGAPATSATSAEPSDELRAVYRSCDLAVGRVVEAAGPGSTVLVVSLHGMGPNASRSSVLPAMLDRILHRTTAKTKPEPAGVLRRMRQSVPLSWRTRVKDNLPSLWQERLSVFWMLHGKDWQATRALSAEGDMQGYVRINLRGREAAGTVAPGDYDRVCEQISEGLATFVDADTGQPVVETVGHVGQIFPHGPRQGGLPDLVVRWNPTPAVRHRAIASPDLGTIDWPTLGHVPGGRTGNHREQGFAIAAGREIAPGSRIEGGNILDVAPTICDWLGVARPSGMLGSVLQPIPPASD